MVLAFTTALQSWLSSHYKIQTNRGYFWDQEYHIAVIAGRNDIRKQLGMGCWLSRWLQAFCVWRTFRQQGWTCLWQQGKYGSRSFRSDRWGAYVVYYVMSVCLTFDVCHDQSCRDHTDANSQATLCALKSHFNYYKWLCMLPIVSSFWKSICIF